MMQDGAIRCISRQPHLVFAVTVHTRPIAAACADPILCAHERAEQPRGRCVLQFKVPSAVVVSPVRPTEAWATLRAPLGGAMRFSWEGEFNVGAETSGYWPRYTSYMAEGGEHGPALVEWPHGSTCHPLGVSAPPALHPPLPRPVTHSSSPVPCAPSLLLPLFSPGDPILGDIDLFVINGPALPDVVRRYGSVGCRPQCCPPMLPTGNVRLGSHTVLGRCTHSALLLFNACIAGMRGSPAGHRCSQDMLWATSDPQCES